MKMTVVKRIVVGFTVSVCFSLAIFLVGFFGIKTVNQDLQKINAEAVPMLDYAGSIKSGVLETTLILEAYYLASLSKLADHKQQYTTVKEIALDDFSQFELVIDPSLSDSLIEIQSGMTKLFSEGEEMMQLRQEALVLKSQLEEDRDVFTDLGDEVIGYIYELERFSDINSVYRFVEKSANDIDNVSASVSEALESESRAMVFGAKKQLLARFESFDKDLKVIEGVLGGEKSFESLVSASRQYKESGEKLLADHSLVLEKINASTRKLQAAEKAEVATKDLLDEVIWAVKDIVDIIQAEAADHVATANRRLMIFSILGVVLSAAFAAYVVMSIRKPLNKTLDEIGGVAQGDLTTQFTVTSNDEFGDLSSSMQGLTQQLRSMMQEITNNADALGEIAQQTSGLSQQSDQNATGQKEQTDMVVVALEEMSATVEEVARNVSSTLTEVEGAYQLVQEGNAVVNKNIENITDLASNINEAAGVIQQLNEDTNTIGGVLDVIRGIAEQTNLLALNAAIEAARAGEQGRGFAVVADEVRTLASRTHDSTAEIHAMIEKLQERARHAVETMDLSQQEATESADNIQVAGDALKNISESITTIKDMSQQIAVASEEQAAVTKEQVVSMTTISELSDKAAEGAKEGLSSSSKMVEMSSTLQKLIHQFKV